ncbi:MAG: acyl-CoA/acyl-ACP dehydrogenase [Acidimicrobiales bacterium]|nr:acyl-CoA/acyl-ACP dehydrogenase [Acidimicrobiales bacterium]
MNFTFTDDQLLFRDAVRDLFAGECPPEAVRAAWDSDDGRVAGLWAKMAAMGVVGLTAPEASGGMGMTELDLVLLLEESGFAASPEPLTAHTAVALPVLAEAAPDHPLLSAGAAGEATLAVALGHGDLVLGGAAADAIVVPHGDGLGLVPAENVAAAPAASVDESRRLAAVTWAPDAVTELTSDPAARQRAFDRGALAAAAECVGVAQRLLDYTVEYVTEREQFGKPVGVNQAVKHHLSNVGLALEFARPMVYRAAWGMAAGDTDPSPEVSMAKALASDAVDLACRNALQCHGAIGYTVEYDLQLWLKRGWALAASWGSAADHRRAVAAVLLG